MGATARTVDFSNVKDGGNFNRKRIKAGDYAAKITKVEDAVAKDDVAQYLFTIKLVNPSTSVFPYYCKLTENQLWKLRNLFIAAGIAIPKKKTKVDPNRLLNKIIGVTIEDDEYEGKEQSTISGVFPASELDDSAMDTSDDGDDDTDVDDDGDDDGDDIDTSVDADDEDSDDEDDSDDEESADEGDKFDAMDRNELKALLKKHDSSFVAKKSQSDDDLRELARAAEAKAGTKAKASTKSSKKSTKDLSDEDIEDLDIDDI